MSTTDIRQALEQHLVTLDGSFSTAHENEDFMPTVNVPYQECHLLPATPDNSAIGGQYYRERGIFQVMLRYPTGDGAGDASAKADAIQAHFKRGTLVSNDGVGVRITHSPAVGIGREEDGWWCVPISIQYMAEMFS